MLKQIRRENERQKTKARSCWGRGVHCYVDDFIDYLEELESFRGSQCSLDNPAALKIILLNGASDWLAYSYTGNSLCYNYDIAKRLCTPSEFKRCKEGYNNPNSKEDWCQCQARALYQAFFKLKNIINNIKTNCDVQNG